jgi:hypothetical protein
MPYFIGRSTYEHLVLVKWADIFGTPLQKGLQTQPAGREDTKVNK